MLLQVQKDRLMKTFIGNYYMVDQVLKLCIRLNKITLEIFVILSESVFAPQVSFRQVGLLHLLTTRFASNSFVANGKSSLLFAINATSFRLKIIIMYSTISRLFLWTLLNFELSGLEECVIDAF